jgi:phosphatidylinositol 3-kinase
MDKDNKEDFSFGRSCDLKVPVTFRMSVSTLPLGSFCLLIQTRSQLEGVRHPRPFTEIIDKPELRFHGVQSPYARLPNCPLDLEEVPNILISALSDLFVTCQLLADNKPLTIPFQTSYKTFKSSYTLALNRNLLF